MDKTNKLSSKLAYGSADIYGGGAFLIIGILYLVFLTDVVHMPAAVAGTIPLIGRIWDAVTDPLMGNIVDRTKSRFGAKRLYLLIGSLLSGVTFAFMWLMVDGGATVQYVYYLITYILFSTAFTIVMVPYNALLPDMVEDYTLRSQYTAYRMIFSATSAIIGGLLPNMIINSYPTAKSGYLMMGIIFGVIFMIAVFMTFKGSWEKEKPIIKRSFKESFSSTFSVFKNYSFRMYLGVFLLGQGSADFIMSTIIYFLAVVMMNPESYTTVMAAVLISQLLAMVFYRYMLKTKSKRWPIYFGIPLRMIATVAILFFAKPGGSMLPIIICCFLAGFGTAAGTIAPFSMLPDLTDVDYLITKTNRPGVYSGMATFARKIASGITIWIIGVLLDVFQYDSYAAVQSATTVTGVKILFIAIPIVMMLATFWFTKQYPLDRENFEVLKKVTVCKENQTEDFVTDSDRKIVEKITGYKYEELWNEANANV